MITDKTAACACCIAALVTLKGLMPETITVRDKTGNITAETVTYEEKSGIIYCSCRDYYAYAKRADSSVSLFSDGISAVSVADNSELLKMIFNSIAKVGNGISGAVIHLCSYNGNVF